MQKRLVGHVPFYLKFWVKVTALAQIADFRSIFARSASAVTPFEKSSIVTNRKSITRFPMSPRWISYIVPKPPQRGAQKRKVSKIWTISCDISETVRYNVSYYWSLIGSRIQSFDWYRPRWPWMTLNGVIAFFCVFAFFASQICRSGWILTYIVRKYCLPVPVFHFWP